MRLSSILKRTFSTTSLIKPKICIVGSGPAGFYTAQHLSKKLGSSEIDIYERLPVPFGLIRFGVAPDHPDVKNVIHTFTKTAQLPNVRFVGNVNLGPDITLKELKKAYHIIILAYGAEKNRSLNISGENLSNVLPARRIVGWYNGIPWDKDLNIDLSGENVAIFGQGNVAIDVARMLLTPVDELKSTDITQFALDALSKSKIKSVQLIGRRGPLQVAYTIKELREMLRLKGCNTIFNANDFINVAESLSKLQRPRKRLTQLMLDSLKNNNDLIANENREFKPIFFRSPLEMLGKNKVEGALLGVTELKENQAILTNQKESINCDLVVTSIGYKSIQVDEDIPFDDRRGIIKNVNGKIEKGLYSCGWVSTGPLGVILATMNDAFATSSDIIKDVQQDELFKENKPGYEEVLKILKQRNIQIVSWKDWLKIDEYEQNEGSKVYKPREKIVDIKKMLEIAA